MQPSLYRSTIAVIGGAGYIGSHTAMALAKSGRRVVVIDNLSTGHREAARFGAFVEADIGETETIRDIFIRFRVGVVFHFAALSNVGESVTSPRSYYCNNVRGSISLLDAMLQADVKKIIFSSTCSLYGKTDGVPLTEEHVVNPMNPYARTKLCIEWALRDYAEAYGMHYTCLRYFNAAGAAPEAGIGERHEPETHLIPLALRSALEPHRVLKIFGEDYPTPDGTCVRDYIHVCDLADAHILALERLQAGEPSTFFNLGSGRGYSVKEVINCAENVTGRQINSQVVARREGDPPILVAAKGKAESELGWRPRFDTLEEIIKSAWSWEQLLAMKRGLQK